MDTIDYATKLVKEFGIDQSDAIKMLDCETDDERNDNFRARKMHYSEALDAAYECIREWLATGDEYAVKLNWEDIAQFVSGHRRACVWAVLTCKARQNYYGCCENRERSRR